jgi:hypothetical protein
MMTVFMTSFAFRGLSAPPRGIAPAVPGLIAGNDGAVARGPRATLRFDLCVS